MQRSSYGVDSVKDLPQSLVVVADIDVAAKYAAGFVGKQIYDVDVTRNFDVRHRLRQKTDMLAS